MNPTREPILEPLTPDMLPRRIRLMTQARATILAGLGVVILGLMIGAAVVPPGASTPVMIVGGAIGGTVLLIGLFMLAFGARWQSAVNTMVGGDYYVYWTYDQDQWREHVTRAHSANRLVPWLMAGGFTLSGVVASWAMVADGDPIADSPALTWAILGGSFTALGVGVGVFVAILGRRRHAQLLDEAGDVFIGPTGFYINGDYWPWTTFGQRLESLKTEPGPPMEIVFTFRIQQKHGSTTKDVRLPVPRGREEEWHAVQARLGRK